MARRTVSPWGFIGMGAMACVLFLVVATAWVAPWWVTLLLLLLWAFAFSVAATWWVRHPTWVPWPAVVVFAVWLPIISIGSRAWGWR